MLPTKDNTNQETTNVDHIDSNQQDVGNITTPTDEATDPDLPETGNIDREIPDTGCIDKDQQRVGNTTTPAAGTTDPDLPGTGNDCPDPISASSAIDDAPASDTDPSTCANGPERVGKSEDQISVETDIREEVILINAVISSQFPSGVDDLCILIKKSIPELDCRIGRITRMLAYWKQHYGGSGLDTVTFDDGLKTGRIAQKWALDLELACERACGSKYVADLPVFTERLDMPIEVYFERFHNCFGSTASNWYNARQLWGRYLDVALKIDMGDIESDFQAAKDYLIRRFGRVPNYPGSVLPSDSELSAQSPLGKKSESSKDWYDPTLVKPCPLNGHGHHEVGTCVDFLFRRETAGMPFLIVFAPSVSTHWPVVGRDLGLIDVVMKRHLGQWRARSVVVAMMIFRLQMY